MNVGNASEVTARNTPSLAPHSAAGLRNQPAYQFIKRRLVQALSEGVYPAGSILPSEKVLSAQYGVSIGTLRKAVDELVADGILIRQQGRGTFVALHDNNRLLYYFFHIVRHDGKKLTPKVKLVSFKASRASRDDAIKLQMMVGDKTLKIVNILSLDDEPTLMDVITLDASRFPGLTQTQFIGRPSSIYNLYQTDFDETVVRTSERLRATSATDQQAALLQVPVGHPLLSIRRIALGFHDDPIEWRESFVCTDKYEYFSELSS